MNISDIFNFSNVLKFLPLSPFKQFIPHVKEIPGLAYLNWFVPVSEIAIVLTAWGVAIGIFYLYSIILRWIKAIQ